VNKFSKFSAILVVLLLVLTAFSFSQEATSTTSESTGLALGIAAIVNGEKITTDKLDFEAQIPYTLAQLKNINERMYNVLVGTKEGYDFLVRYRKAILDELIDGILITQYAQRVGIKVSDEEVVTFVNNYIDQVLKQYNISQNDLEQYIKAQGYSDLGTYKNRLAEKRRLMLYLQRLMDYVTKDVKVSEEQIKQFYEENKEKFVSQGSAHVAHILLGNEDDAKKVMERLNEGEKFEDLAKELSLDEFSKIKGGDLGWIESGNTDLDPNVSKAIFSNDATGIIGPVQSQYGWHVIKIIERGGKGIKPLEDVRQSIENYLLEQEKNKKWQEWLNNEYKQFKESSEIKIFI
jgi:foldase protein PrsA